MERTIAADQRNKMTMEWKNSVKLVDDILKEIAFAMVEDVDVVSVWISRWLTKVKLRNESTKRKLKREL